MSDAAKQDQSTGTERDYRDTVFLPKTDFPMRAGLPKREPGFLQKWEADNIYQQLRDRSTGRPKWILHDGPPYANGDIHMGHAFQKTLKDVVVRVHQMQGYDAPYVPGWDCHGLPIEWKIEEKYRKKKKNKDEVDPVEFRRECRDFAAHWIDVQKGQFKRLGIFGDWDNPYTTMAYPAEAKIATEILRVAKTGALYQGSKPVMWSPVEKTALAEAEVEYQDHVSTQIDVAFTVVTASTPALEGAEIVIWTTTPWTIPGNRAICYGAGISYVVIAHAGRKLVVAEALLEAFSTRLGIAAPEVTARLTGADIAGSIAAHPWRGAEGADGYYDFDVPLLDGDHVTTDAGTGFVHTAPGHGQEDFEVATLKHGIAVPHTVAEDGRYFAHVPLMQEAHVYKVADHVCSLLGTALLASSQFEHSYPHSWRSKAPLIFRNTAQWFISMDKTGLRDRALTAIQTEIRWVPSQGQNRIESMVRDRPDWVISRQRAWGVPIPLFVHKESRDILIDDAVNDRIIKSFEAGGADAWFATPAADYLGDAYSVDDYEQVMDVIDVWFDSGCTHAFVAEDREELTWPADLYLEGSDQHRGWFQSSLLEACLTRGAPPYKNCLTHGFVMDGDGRKMSKSLGNVVSPLKVIDQYGADILRLWTISTDFQDDVRISDTILQGQIDAYRKMRNTLRYMLGSLEGFSDSERVDPADMPPLERYVLHRLAELDGFIRDRVSHYDVNPVLQALYQFCIQDLSAFYFDIRKDSLYCDAPDSPTRRACRTVLDMVFDRLVTWLAPVLVFTAEEAWQSRYGMDADSVHLELWRDTPKDWLDADLAARWAKVREVRSEVLLKLEEARRAKDIGASLQAQVLVTAPAEALEAFKGLNAAEIFITSGATLAEGDLAVTVARADGNKCGRCWTVLPEVAFEGALCNRCDAAVTYLEGRAPGGSAA